MADVQSRSTMPLLQVGGWTSAGATQGHVRGWLTDLLVAAVAISAAVIARIAVEQLVGGVIPFVLTFPVVLVATLSRGGRAGTLTAVGCQLLTIRFVFPNWTAAHGGQPTELANLLLSTLSLAGMIWAASRFRSVSALLQLRCEREVETLSLVISEMDHRTKNNFQIAASMLSDQARSTGSDVAARELVGASNRLGAIASVYRNLALTKDRSGSVQLAPYLADIVGHLRKGVVPSTISIATQGDAVQVASHKAMIIGLIVNEWIANALKYAFPDACGSIHVSVAHAAAGIVVTVSDNGSGDVANGQVGIGSRLMSALAATIDARISVDSSAGTTCTLFVGSQVKA